MGPAVSIEELRGMRYGDTAIAGLHIATVIADMDFETYSEAGFIWNEETQKWDNPPGVSPNARKGLGVVGTRRYVEHPSFEPLMLKYDLKDGAGQRYWLNGDPPPQALFDHLASGKLIEAWNSGFEVEVWEWCVKNLGWPVLPVFQVRCAMAKSRAHARPGALAKAATVAGTLDKDAAGDGLIKRFCVPQKPTAKAPSKRIKPTDDWDGFMRLFDYCGVDIESEAHISINTPDLLPIELEYWQFDQAINRRGVHVDIPTLHAAIKILAQAEAVYGREVREITGGISASELQQLKGWCAGLGCHMPGMTEEDVADALQRDDLHPLVRRVLEIRALIGSASVKKTYAMVNQACSLDRLHHLFAFHKARTGRPTGQGPQPTNLPKAGPGVWLCLCGKYSGEKCVRCPWCLRGPELRLKNARDGEIMPLGSKPLEWSPEAMFDAIEIMQYGDLALLEMFFGDALLTMAGCLRGMFTAGPGKRLISSDYTAIEAVVLACLAGEQWRIDLFLNKEKIYEKSGALVTGIPYQEILDYAKRTGQHHPARQIGKTAELGLGYQGWVGAWRNFDKTGGLSDDEVKKIILAWRDKSPAIVEFWGGQSRGGFGRGELRYERFGVEGAFIDAILRPGEWQHFRGLWFIKHGDAVYIKLPSGRHLTYHDVKLRASDKYGSEYAISYWGWNTNPLSGPVDRWIEMQTWGGKLVENIVQAVSNDILRYATGNLERAGYPLVLHVYDEVVAEVAENFGSVEELERLMVLLPEWAKLADGRWWPIGAAGGWAGKRYRKG